MRHVCWTGAESQCCCLGRVRVRGFTDGSDALQLQICSLWHTNTNPLHIVKEKILPTLHIVTKKNATTEINDVVDS